MVPQGRAGALAELGLLLLLWQDVFAMEVPLDFKQPPTITKQSMKEHLADPKEGIFIECEAKGNPFPSFSWLRNGKYYNVPRDSWVSMRRWSGTLDMGFGHGRRPEEYEAEYQCFATNEYGSAVSDKIRLRIAKSPLWPKEVLEPVAVNVGFPLILPCNPPGLPRPQTFWMNSSMLPIPQDRRVSMGANGDLYFSHITINDSLTDYSCNARFKAAQTVQQKSPYALKVLTTRMVAETVPSFLTPSGTSSIKVVLRGEELILECIPAGFPTPVVRWYKKGGDVPLRKVKLENFNKTLRIPRATDDDTADYTCIATNRKDVIRHVFNVQVKVLPYWVEKPANLIVAPDENGRIVCRAQGTPKPTVQWLVNGEPLEIARPNPSRQVSGDTLVFRSVQVGSSAVYQCNASNDYGYILANAFVHILDAAPRMLGPWNQVVKVIENNRTFLNCPYFGAPVPELRWFKDGLSAILTGGQYRTLPNGTLEIRRVRSHDQGSYTCVAVSRMGRAENHVRLEVKEPTRFLRSPLRLTASRGSLARLDCKAKHDITLPITVTWLRDNKPISLGWRLRKEEDHLAIPGIHREDEGKYTCIIKTELDEISASARVTVIDRPDPPTDLELSDPSERSVRLTWVPGDDNHSPILEFLVQFEEDRWLAGGWQNLSSYPGNLNSVILQLAPFTIYQFRVFAINAIGWSRPSPPSQRYKTSGAPPDAIPQNIRGVGYRRTNMEISWQALKDTERNGPYLRYVVWWRRRDSREEWKNATTYWRRYYIYDTDTFTPYEIKVQAMNDFGLGPESPIIIGYSGEDRPLAAPTNVRVTRTESTTATVHWTPVPQNSIMGALKEYKVYYWRDSSMLPWLSVRRDRRSRGFYTTSPRPWGLLTELMPYSNYRMHMVVANNRYEGPPSTTIEFQTKEGVPGPPEYLTVQQRHLDTIYVEWEPPPEPNGILTGYTLTYQTVNGSREAGRLQVQSLPVNVTSFSMRRPDRYTRYKFTLVALTQLGAGEERSEESPHYTTEAFSREQVDISTQGWFIGVMCAGALLVLILLIVCFIKRSRGGKYPVREKKDMPMDSGDEKDQDGSFDYRINRVSTLPYPKRDEDSRQMQASQSQASLDGRVKMHDSEDDSLVEYGDGGDGDGQFDEDGSFIGQYTGKKDREEPDCIPRSEPTSPINAIYSLA
ncbi:neurofascin-like isoform X2 [Anguilla anguilla]|uniref:neurofascin-like isoform X2 n=1 Tax=Anguilla anguilla TaxID=7936 RepID=UPI0015B1D260|nr:neurofascin-like isoform X2 [Anguilla anguilla]